MRGTGVRWLVLGALAKPSVHIGQTAHDLARKTGCHLGQIRTRLLEMSREGLVVEHGERVRSTTGRMVTQWEITPKGREALASRKVKE